MSTCTRTVVLGLALSLGGLTAPAPSRAAAAEPLPCLPIDGESGFWTNPPLAPGGPSEVSFRFPRPASGEVENRIVSRPDGTKTHEFPIGTSRYGLYWEGWDYNYTYTMPDLGTWIMHDSDGQPWRRFTVKAASWFPSLVGPGRIVTAGEAFTLTARVGGWTATGAGAPVRGMPVTVTAVLPTGEQDWSRTTATSPAGTISVPVRVISNRKLPVSTARYGCYTHAGVDAPPLDLQVRKRITATPGTTTPAVGQYVQIRGTVYPARANQPIYLQRWNGTSFETVTPGQTNGQYTFAYRPTSAGSHLLRVYTPFDSWHVSSGSPNLRLTAR